MTERWLPVVGFEGYYEVSDLGRVRSLDRIVVRRQGNYNKAGRVLKLFAGGDGYLRVDLFKGKRLRKVGKVHQLVARAFLGEGSVGLWVLHTDDDKTNNAVSNLRYGTASDNAYDRVRNGNHPWAGRSECKRGHTYTPENTIHREGRGRECRTCSEESHRRSIMRRREIVLPDGDRRHGTNNGYQAYGCRCDACIVAGRAYRGERSKMKRSREVAS